ncbi:MAG: ABC transporter permease subunit [Deltaproteobacteria bacterium]|nr:ABC transporter permease subunit [Deltaproteobacteria bacterium]
MNNSTASRYNYWREMVRRWFIIRDHPSKPESLRLALSSVVLLIVIWQILTYGAPEERIIDNLTLPSPWETVTSFYSLWFDRALARSAVWSLGRVLGGFILAAAIGIPLGVLASSFRRFMAFLQPLLIFGRNVPIAALIPLTLIWFGLGETQKVMFIFFSCVAFIVFDSSRAIDAIPDSYLDTAYTLGAVYVPRQGLIWATVIGLTYGIIFFAAYLMLSTWPGSADPGAVISSWLHGLIWAGLVGVALGFGLWYPITAYQAVRKVLLPLALPEIFNSLRLIFGLAFGYIMLAEVINAEHGLGSIIILSQRRGPREHIYLALVIIALLAFGIDRLMLYAQKKLFPYRVVGE